MNKLNEGVGGNIDKLYSLFDKAKSSVTKAQNAILDIADVMDEILVESTAIGGKVNEIIPSHAKMHIANLTQLAEKTLGEIAEGEGQSSIKKLKELIENIPYRDLKPQSTEVRRQQISTQPNLTAGPQSQIAESLEDYYRDNVGYSDNNFSFTKLTESKVYGQKLEEDMMAQMNMKQAAPVQQARQIREKVRTAVNDDFFEDQEQLQESGPLDFSKIRAFGGADGMPLRFDTLTDTGHVVPEGIK